MLKNDGFEGLVDRVKLEEFAKKNNKLNDIDAQRFVESIMENYFLDNDNINFLENKGINFFTFSDDEDCFCISGELYKNCCKKKLKDKQKNNYKTYIESLMNEDDYKNYLDNIQKIYMQEYDNFNEKAICKYPGCSIQSQLNNFYHEVDLETYVSHKLFNPFDAKFQMGNIFFKDADIKAFEYFGFCHNHFNEIKELHFKGELNDIDVVKLSLENNVYKLVCQLIYFNALKKEFLDNFNSVEDMGFKAYMVVNLRKAASQLKGLINFYSLSCKNIDKNILLRMKIFKFKLPKSKKMWCHDLLVPQITPDNFKTVNSVNNVLLPTKYISMCITNLKKESIVYFLYEKMDEKVYDFVNQFQQKLLDNKKGYEHFYSNCSLILADNILFDKKWFNKLDKEEKVLYSALSKYRYESPDQGKEYIKMQFFAGFDKGNNFF